MKEYVKIISNGSVIRQDEVIEAVQKGNINAMNWDEYSKLIAEEIEKQHDAVFEICFLSRMSFKWREWVGMSAETILNYVMLVVKGRYSHDVADLPAYISSAFLF